MVGEEGLSLRVPEREEKREKTKRGTKEDQSFRLKTGIKSTTNKSRTWSVCPFVLRVSEKEKGEGGVRNLRAICSHPRQPQTS
jgi:hypothetical protein